MIKPTYNYSDWYKGQVYLETGAILTSKTDNPIKARLSDFSEKDRKRIELKQKEIFDSKCSAKLTIFKNSFIQSFKNSETKELLLKREIEDNRKILYLNPVQELHFKNRSSKISKEDLSIMRHYINTQIVKGEKYYGFVHSPNFKFQYEKVTNDLVYARVTFDYYTWLIKFQDSHNNSTIILKKDQAPIPKKDNSIKGGTNKKVIALIYFYNGQPINRISSDEIAAKFKYTAKTSGEDLRLSYIKFSNNNRRTKLVGESKVKCLNRLEYIEKVITHLDGKAQEHAKKDFQTLEKAINENEW